MANAVKRTAKEHVEQLTRDLDAARAYLQKVADVIETINVRDDTLTVFGKLGVAKAQAMIGLWMSGAKRS